MFWQSFIQYFASATMISHLLLSALPLMMILLIILSIYDPRHTTKAHQCHQPPGPKGLPFLGNLHQFAGKPAPIYLWALSKIYGPVMSLKFGSVPTLVISSAKLAKEVMATHDSIFASRHSLVGSQKLSYNGIDIVLAPLNDYRREMKRISVVHLLNPKHIQSSRLIRQDELSRMVKEIAKHSSSGEIVNLNEIVMFYCCNFISRVAVARSYDVDENSGKRRFDQLQDDLHAMLGRFYLADFFPSLRWIDIFTGQISRLEKNFKELDSFFQELIDERLNGPKPSNEQLDILDILLKLKQERSSLSVELTFDHIKAQLMNVFIAGTDMVSVVIVWAMTALMKAPEAMKRVQAEIRESVGKKGLVEEEDIQYLPYLKAVIKETMRMYPPGPLLVPRETTESCILEGHEIQPKTLVLVNAWAIGRDSEYWGNNVDEFLPERFLNSIIDFRGKDFGLIPFGAGRRMCPGISMGIAVVEAVLAKLLYTFDWELPSGMVKEDIDMDFSPGAALHKKIPLCLIAKRHA